MCDKAFSIAKNPKYDGYQRVLASMVYKFFEKKNSGGTVKNENISNKERPEEWHKPNIRKFKKRKVHSTFIDNIWGYWSCRYAVNKYILVKNLDFYYVSLIFSVNMHGLFLWKRKMMLQLLMLLKNV